MFGILTKSMPVLQVSDLCSVSAPEAAQDPDWVESAQTVAHLRSGQPGRHAASLISTEHMARLSIGWRPPSPRQVAVQDYLNALIEILRPGLGVQWGGGGVACTSRLMTSVEMSRVEDVKEILEDLI